MLTLVKTYTGYVIDLNYDESENIYNVTVRTETVDESTGDLVDHDQESHHQIYGTYVKAYDLMRELGNEIENREEVTRPVLYDEVLEVKKAYLPTELKQAHYKTAGLAWVMSRVAGDTFDVFINQKDRPAKVLAVLPPRGSNYGGLPRILAEYKMPKGSTALFTIGCGKLSYGSLAKHREWLHAIRTQTGSEGHKVTTYARKGGKGTVHSWMGDKPPKEVTEREGSFEILPICGQAQGGATWCYPVNPPIYLGGNGTEGNKNRERKFPITCRKYRNISYEDWGFKFEGAFWINWDSTSADNNPWVARAEDFIS